MQAERRCARLKILGFSPVLASELPAGGEAASELTAPCDRPPLLQGKTGLWFAGGYRFPYDAQETALLSSIEVANGLNGGSTPRGDALLASL